MKVFAVDFGLKRIGLAVSDPSGFLASGLATIENNGFQAAAQEIAQTAQENRAEKIVIGYPKNMDGSIGPAAQRCASLAKEIQQLFPGEVLLWDERGTTVSAHGFLNETNTRGKKRKAVVDKLAAEIILQSYLDSIRLSGI